MRVQEHEQEHGRRRGPQYGCGSGCWSKSRVAPCTMGKNLKAAIIFVEQLFELRAVA